jgi:hypothetical protein
MATSAGQSSRVSRHAPSRARFSTMTAKYPVTYGADNRLTGMSPSSQSGLSVAQTGHHPIPHQVPHVSHFARRRACSAVIVTTSRSRLVCGIASLALFLTCARDSGRPAGTSGSRTSGRGPARPASAVVVQCRSYDNLFGALGASRGSCRRQYGFCRHESSPDPTLVIGRFCPVDKCSISSRLPTIIASELNSGSTTTAISTSADTPFHLLEPSWCLTRFPPPSK